MTEHDTRGAALENAPVIGPTVLRRIVLIGAPLALAVLEIFHPDPGGASEAVEQGGWFLWFHMIQLPLIGLMVLAVYLLTEGMEGPAVRVSRWAAGVFAVFFSAYDAAAGIATGFALRNARGLPAEAQAAVFEAVKDMPGLSLIFVLSIVGTGGWVVALIAAALALRRAGASRGPFVLLILAGVLLLGGHPFPFGTLAFGCFFVAAAWLELAPRATARARARTTEQESTPRQREARGANAGRR
jgi:hypothetical protein